MRIAAILVGLLLLMPFAVAAPSVIRCTELGCVVLQDRDGDDAYDWANAAMAIEHAVTVNANADDRVLTAHVDVGTEETVNPFHVAGLSLQIDATDERPRAATVWFEVYDGDEDTGATSSIVWTAVFLDDTDGDGVADRATVGE